MIGSCASPNHGTCTGYQSLSLFDSTGDPMYAQYVYYCGDCVQFTFEPAVGSGCESYTLKEECASGTSTCSGTATVGTCAPPTSYVIYGGLGVDTTDDQFHPGYYDDSYGTGVIESIDLNVGLTAAQGFRVIGSVTVVRLVKSFILMPVS